MKKVITVLVGDYTKEFGQVCTEILTRHGFAITNTEKDGNELLNRIQSDLPDVVVMDAYMKNLDAIAVMEQVKMLEIKQPKFIVTSAYDNEFIQNEVMKLGASCFILKPFDLNMLANRISRLIDFTQNSYDVIISEKEQDALLAEITKIMQRIGIPVHLKGYRYIREGILLAVNDNSVLDSITKILYPEIAKKFSTTSVRVERSIRHAITAAWDRGDLEVLNSYFGYKISNLGDKPTNSELIAMISDNLSLNKNRRNG